MAELAKTPQFIKMEREIEKWEKKFKTRMTTLKRERTKLKNLKEQIEEDHRIVATEYVPLMRDVALIIGKVKDIAALVDKSTKIKKKHKKEIFNYLQNFGIDNLDETLNQVRQMFGDDEYQEDQEETDIDEEDNYQYESEQKEYKSFSDLLDQFKKDVSEKDKKELRRLFTSLATKFHPDKARSNEEANFFHVIMQRINHAYQNADVAELMKIEKEYKDYHTPDPEQWSNDATLDFMQGKIDRIKRDYQMVESQLSRIKTEASELKNSDVATLTQQNKNAAKYGANTMSDDIEHLRQTKEALNYTIECLEEALQTGKLRPEYEDRVNEIFEIDEESFEDEEDEMMELLSMLFNEMERNTRPNTKRKRR